MAEIKIEPKRRSLLPWILGLILLALVLWGLMAMANRKAAAADRGTAARDSWRDDTPPRLRQYASAEPHPRIPAGARHNPPRPSLARVIGGTAPAA